MEQEYFWMQPVSQRLEFKQTWPGGSQIAHTAISFTNGADGRIVFGVKDEPREIIGTPEDEIFKLEEKAYDVLTPNKYRTSTEQVKRILLCFNDDDFSVKELLVMLKLKHRPTFLENYLNPALNSGFIEMTQPDSPKSPTQKYRLTDLGRKMLNKDAGNNVTL
jgi:predicted HTH transcriptional regulator